MLRHPKQRRRARKEVTDQQAADALNTQNPTGKSNPVPVHPGMVRSAPNPGTARAAPIKR